MIRTTLNSEEGSKLKGRIFKSHKSRLENMKMHKRDHFVAIYYGCLVAKPPRSEAVISVAAEDAEGLPPSSVKEQTSTEFNLSPL